MTAIGLEQETNTYWNLIKSVSKEVKLALIARLSNSLVASAVGEEETQASLIADIMANAPEGVGMTDDEIVQEVKAVRYAR